jgi:stearoyl-CoA desaturase (delta-9 desaturase)
MSASVGEVKRLIAEKNTRMERLRRVAPKPLPNNVTLEDILKSLPSEVFTQDKLKSFGSLFVTLLMLSISMYLLAVLPWYLWPLGWVLGGASVTGLFAIANDCMNSSFTKSKLVNYIVGTVAMLPLGYSFYSLKTHSKYRNLSKGVQAAREGKLSNYIWKWAKGKTFWLASIGHWAEDHFDVNLFNPRDRLRVRISFVGLYAFGAVFFSLMFYYVGLMGIVKYWLLPWLLYHFLVSTTTLLPSVAVEEHEKGRWFAVHCDYPKWLEFLCNDISLAIPRNISSAIPHYHLRKAYNSLKQQWGEYFVEIHFEWALLSDLMKSAPLQTFTPIPRVPVAPIVDEEVVQKVSNIPSPSRHGGVFGFLRKVNWMHASILIPTPLIALYGLVNYPLLLPTVIWSFVYYYMTGVGITAGYHRLFAHRAYKARQPFKFIIMMLGAGAVEGSVRWWARDHRAHHRYTDTNKDPYSAQQGFWWSHIGWMLMKQDSNSIGRASIEDLNQDPWIRWQHKYYLYIAIFMGILFPTIVAGVGWGDWAGGYFFAAVLRLVFVHHSTFMVNSLAHYLGTASYADKHTPRDSIVTAVLTLGEGYHNFHHEFPQDYRNAIRFYQYDPTKWTIRLLSYIGQTYDLKKFPENEVQKGQIQMRQKVLDKMKKKVDWGLSPDELPIVSKEVFDEVLNEGFKLVVIDDIVHDVTDFIEEHPGGRAILATYVGKDATRQFNGEVYDHSNGAHNLLSQMRVGRVDKAEWDIIKKEQVVFVDEAAAHASKKNI